MDEYDLNYWREDPLLSDHHEHWHLVYPYTGSPDRNAHTDDEIHDASLGLKKLTHFIWDSRHGELFAYMHSQMLARYYSERLSWGLSKVQPFEDYYDQIKHGYSPNIELTIDGKVLRPANRPNNASLNGLTHGIWKNRPGADLSMQSAFKVRLAQSIELTSPNRPSNINELAEKIEPTDRNSSNYFGALHNDGHLLISMFDDVPNSLGVLFWEAHAIRDPVFYMWHAHIDSFFNSFKEHLPSHSFSDLPDVTVTDFKVVSKSEVNSIVTKMGSRTIQSSSGDDYLIKYLYHEGFSYQIQVTNNLLAEQIVTARIFLAPNDSVDDRKAWIEMDKFNWKLSAKQEVNITRDSTKSSVIRHPAITKDTLDSLADSPAPSASSAACECGWPYTLLVPKGKAEGMPFIIFIIFSQGSDLNLPPSNQEGGFSYCGVKDSKYPDSKPMGYPFDRPLPGKMKISDWINAKHFPQLFSKTISIRHE